MVSLTAISRHEDSDSERRSDAPFVVPDTVSKCLYSGMGITGNSDLGIYSKLGWAAMAGYTCWWDTRHVGR
ncbi:hypothetical protein GUITHDRAFT_100208 [Guillardia theta CCMP2712]|uniref:Uncharacterized protein n=1 Tax=Guillardia theta (strain CCMP2712) TaxID=905079 RepID=L1K0R5_GUITC|nr:hypothetical protein GUITHDRAFT_100208 [Guillardia theta CCMP2712]EKX53958.1 hypothetical protein GUITHDRAFT_100208 [Guillardia theta CCMP2712]|eukprot:XP_005840938.1 hypothetical protein GUITHDRAFT_100208 [Guillardia theta CCMP2712]